MLHPKPWAERRVEVNTRGLTFRIYGNPIAWAAPTIRKRKDYEPPRHKEWQEMLRFQLINWRMAYPPNVWDGEPFNCPCVVGGVIMLKRPVRFRNHPLPDEPPDLDNLEKATWDALSKIVYSDDRRIVGKGDISLVWADSVDAEPGAVLEVWPLHNEQLIRNHIVNARVRVLNAEERRKLLRIEAPE